MSITQTDFWKLAIGSGLITKDTARQLHGKYSTVRGATQKGNSRTLAEWLVAEGVLTRYQTGFLLAGRPGPFIFGEYVVSARIEGGRLADLFQAKHTLSGQKVLLYFLSPQATQDPRAWSEFTRQAQAAIALVHPNLCRVLELVDLSAYKFVVLEALNGQSLAEYRGPKILPPSEACRIVRQAALGLVPLHAAGMAHGEVRPQNLWREASGEIKVLGFPLARDPLAPLSLNLAAPDPTGRTALALEYMAPEMAQPGKTPDAFTDVYSLGSTLYELLTGNVPFAGGDPAQKMMRHASEGIQPLDKVPGVSPSLAQLVAYMMAKNARIRIANAAAAAEALAAFTGGSAPRVAPVAAVVPAAAVAPAAQWGGNGNAASQPPIGTPVQSGHGWPQPMPVGVVSPQPVAGVPMGTMPPGTMPLGTVPVAVGIPVMGQPAAVYPVAPVQAAVAPPAAPKAFPNFAAEESHAAVDYRPAPIAHVSRRTAKPPARRVNRNLVVFGAVVAAVVFGGALFIVFKQRAPTDDQVATASKPKAPADQSPSLLPEAPDAAEIKPATAEQPTTEVAAAGPTQPDYRIIDDDQQSLWLPPTSGEPLNLRYLPAGGQALVALRPKDMLSHAEGPKVLAALGPGGAAALARLEAIVGVKLAEIEQLLVSFSHADGGDFPQISFVVRMAADTPKDKLLEAWKNPPLRGEGDKVYFVAGDWAYHVPPGQSRLFAVSSPKRMQEDVLTADGPPLWSKDMEKLLRDTDATRHFTLLVAPSYLLADGKALMSGNLERLQEPLLDYIGKNVPAAMLSAHWDENFYAEFRASSKLDQDPEQLAKNYLNGLASLQQQINKYLFSLSLGEYDKEILQSVPGMMGIVANHVRKGDVNGQAVLNCYLPVEAAHNLVLAGELALLEKPGVKLSAGPAKVAAAAPDKPATVADALKKKISLSFPRDTLEKSMEMLAKELETEIVILGADLQLDGITKNQSFGLDERDKPAGEILRTIMKLANMEGKLIYVIKPKAEGEKDIIFITTRAAAEKRGDKLPSELEVKAAPKKK